MSQNPSKRTSLNRRQLLKGMSASLGLLALRGFEVQAAAAAHFTHGVASGDPLADRVMLWTRLIPGGGEHSSINCQWQVAKDRAFKHIVSTGMASTNSERDYTVKIDAAGLSPNSRYYYRFLSDGQLASPIGRTRTLPVGDIEQIRLGITSCSNYPQGYFNVYRHMAQTDIDLVLHLGDYIYEYAEGVYSNEVATNKLGRKVEPTNEILSLEDYRMRYGLYRTDEDLQLVHARHPFVCVWDDHELANDSWKGGAENHSADEGDFQARMRSARQAYHEWMPIRTSTKGDQSTIFRSFKLGNLADLIMLDTRLHGRDRPLDYAKDLPMHSALFQLSASGEGSLISEEASISVPTEQLKRITMPFDFTSGTPTPVNDYATIKDLTAETLPPGWYYLPDSQSFKRQALVEPDRTILGADQEQWLDSELQASKERGATWQVIGQQVLMGKLRLPLLTNEQLKIDQAEPYVRQIMEMMQVLAPDQMPFNLDAWDGYAVCRDRVFSSFAEHGTNPVVLAGDTHNAWAFNLADCNGQAVGVEVGTPGVSSPGLETYLPTDPAELGKAIQDASVELFAVDTAQRGWSEMTLTPEAMTNQWHFVSTVLDRDFSVESGAVQYCKAGNKRFS
ncbi:alkaline phosphatase D family protein [SAR92 clade bacterium H455]|uniref:Alkaline phosphatase D family protein n=1 Tax=SAR92 clade bacterium H455 TaxID=2974818 RepID=A0ABY5TJ14_9GAMM|nr:alkaline phosphatase D family protein [SAR92 clade bacterium H455]